MKDRNDIKSIVLNMELLMYGHLSLRIDDVEDGIIVKRTSISDGGAIISSEEKLIHHKMFSELIDILSKIELSDEESSDICWSLQAIDYMSNEIFCIDIGYWKQEILENILNELVLFVSDENIFADFFNMLSYQ